MTERDAFVMEFHQRDLSAVALTKQIIFHFIKRKEARRYILKQKETNRKRFETSCIDFVHFLINSSSLSERFL